MSVLTKQRKEKEFTTEQKFQAWLSYFSSIHGKTESEDIFLRQLKGMQEDTAKIEQAFGTELSFRNHGIAGELGVGASRVNFLTIRKAAMGLANYIMTHTQQDTGYELLRQGVVVGYDSRPLSKEFAFETAKVLSSFQIQSYLFDESVPLPLFSFAIRSHEALAGVYITPSSNDSEHSGFKVYDSAGCEINAAAAHDLNEFLKTQSVEKYLNDSWKKKSVSYITHLTRGEDEDYDRNVLDLMLNKKAGEKYSKDFRVVFEPWNGLSDITMQRLMAKAGFSLSVTREHAPVGKEVISVLPKENSRHYSDAIATAIEQSAQLVLATDYTATQLGVFVQHDGDYEWIDGNQLGALLIQYILETRKAKGSMPKKGVLLKNIFTSELAEKVARKYKVEVVDTPVGFNYIGEKMDELQSTKQNLVLGFEENNQFVVGGFVRVPDAFQTALLVCEMAVMYHKKNMTLLDKLDELHNEFGYFKEQSVTIFGAGIEGMERLAQKVKTLRYEPIRSIGYEDVVRVEDFLLGQSADYREVGTKELSVTPCSAVKWYTANTTWMGMEFESVESGVTIYYGTSSNDRERSEFYMAQIQETVNELFGEVKEKQIAGA